MDIAPLLGVIGRERLGQIQCSLEGDVCAAPGGGGTTTHATSEKIKKVNV
jgi:hypothetical protein